MASRRSSTSIDPVPGEAQTALRCRGPRARWLLIPVMAFLAVGGIAGGVSLVLDRSGAGLQADPGWLDRTPVHDFLLPGLFILVVYGLGTSVAILGLLTRAAPGRLAALDRRWGHHWAWVLTIAIGGALVAWILYELLIFSDTIWLQPALLGVGALMVLVPLMPSMLAWYRA
jgi:hypothetical protein